MSISLQLAVRIQNTIEGPLRQVARFSDSETWIGPVAMISQGEIKQVTHLLSSCVNSLRANHESPGL
jgi:hypothetical protein